MLSNIIKVKLEKNSCSFEELEKFFANNTFHINDRKGFQDSLVELVITHSQYGTLYPTLILTLPREGIPNSFALKILSSLYRKNGLALPTILKCLIHRNLSKDFDNISRKLQAKMDQDIQAQNDSEISKEIELCKKDILNVLNCGKSVLDKQFNQRYKAYYSLIDSEIEELKAKILRESEDYVNNTNIHKMYQSLNNKIKKVKHKNEIVFYALSTSGIAALFMLPIAPCIAIIHSIIHKGLGEGGGFFLETLMYTATPFLVVATLALMIACIAYLVNRNYEQSFVREMENFIEKPRYMDKATNTENGEELKPKEKPVPVVDNLIDLNYDKTEDKVQPSAPPLSEMNLKTEGLYPWSGLSK